MGGDALGTLLTGLGTVALGVAALYAAFRAFPEYRAGARAEKARWMSELFQQFYQKQTYRRIRQRIDYGDITEIFPSRVVTSQHVVSAVHRQ